MSAPQELNGIPRMHVHKVRELEEMVWYRENSIRFMKLSKPKAVIGIVSACLLFPALLQSWFVFAKESHLEQSTEVLAESEKNFMTRSFYPTAKDSERDHHKYQRNPFTRATEEYKHDENNGGWPADYRGPKDMLKYKALLAQKYSYPNID